MFRLGSWGITAIRESPYYADGMGKELCNFAGRTLRQLRHYFGLYGKINLSELSIDTSIFCRMYRGTLLLLRVALLFVQEVTEERRCSLIPPNNSNAIHL
jgi:hypothetical protein